MLNPAPAAALSDELLSCLTYVSPNEHEAALLSGLSLKADEHGVDQKDLAAVVQNLCSRGIKKLMITLGSNGAVLCDERDRIQIPCVHMTEVKDPTAAGDSFVGAFCTGIAGGLSEKGGASDGSLYGGDHRIRHGSHAVSANTGSGM